jgi:hypothetical protein
MIYKNFYLNKFHKISFFIKKNQQFLMLQTHENILPVFFKIPISVKIYWTGVKKSLHVGFLKDFSSHNQFISLLNSANGLNISKVYKRKIILKGTGYKINFNENTKILELKLGFSHLCSLIVPTDKIKIQVIKNILCLESFDNSFLGNFTSKIMNLKSKDSYKNKGFLFKNEKPFLKTIKKK